MKITYREFTIILTTHSPHRITYAVHDAFGEVYDSAEDWDQVFTDEAAAVGDAKAYCKLLDNFHPMSYNADRQRL